MRVIAKVTMCLVFVAACKRHVVSEGASASTEEIEAQANQRASELLDQTFGNLCERIKSAASGDYENVGPLSFLRRAQPQEYRVLKQSCLEERIPLEALPGLFAASRVFYVQTQNLPSWFDRDGRVSTDRFYDTACLPVVEVIQVKSDDRVIELAKAIMPSVEQPLRSESCGDGCRTVIQTNVAYRFEYFSTIGLTTNRTQTAAFQDEGRYECSIAFELLERLARGLPRRPAVSIRLSAPSGASL